jgi:hypothetical protein
MHRTAQFGRGRRGRWQDEGRRSGGENRHGRQRWGHAREDQFSDQGAWDAYGRGEPDQGFGGEDYRGMTRGGYPGYGFGATGVFGEDQGYGSGYGRREPGFGRGWEGYDEPGPGTAQGRSWQGGPNWYRQGHGGHGQEFGQGSFGEGFEGRGRGEGRQQFDDDYLHWCSEQLKRFDQDYDDWRNERRQKFSEDFDKWRSSRPQKTEGSRTTSQADMKNR